MAIKLDQLAATDFAELEEDVAAPMFADINITPLTDVMLVLLIVFMVSSSAMVDAARSGELPISLPQAGQSTSATTPSQSLVLVIAANGDLFLQNEPISAEKLATVLKKTYQQNPQTVVLINADGQSPHHNVVTMIDQVRAAGFETVGIGTQAKP